MLQWIRGLAGAAVVALALSGCVSMPKQQAFNRDAHTIKTVQVLPTHATRVSVFMLNHPGMSFGLIGGLVAAGDQASKEKRFNALLAQTGFEPLPYFKERLTAHMTDRGYTLQWPDAQVEATRAKRGPFGLRKEYAAISDADAQLDINFGFVGYAAAGATDGSPYRPTVSVGARLVSPDGRTHYFSDYVIANNVFNMPNAVVVNADQAFSYPDFDDLHRAGPTAVEGLRSAIDSVAAEVARQL